MLRPGIYSPHPLSMREAFAGFGASALHMIPGWRMPYHGSCPASHPARCSTPERPINTFHTRQSLGSRQRSYTKTAHAEPYHHSHPEPLTSKFKTAPRQNSGKDAQDPASKAKPGVQSVAGSSGQPAHGAAPRVVRLSSQGRQRPPSPGDYVAHHNSGTPAAPRPLQGGTAQPIGNNTSKGVGTATAQSRAQQQPPSGRVGDASTKGVSKLASVPTKRTSPPKQLIQPNTQQHTPNNNRTTLPTAGPAVRSLHAEQQSAQDFSASTRPRVQTTQLPLRDLLQERGIVLKVYSEGEHSHLHCPSCQGGNNNDKDLAVTIQPGGREAFWKCFRANCGFSGKVAVGSGNRAPLHPAEPATMSGLKRQEQTAPPVTPQPKWQQLTNHKMLEFFKSRGIGEKTLQRNGIMEEVKWLGSAATHCIAFPYRRGTRLVNIKYRSLNKKFTQVAGADKILFGLDDIANQPEIIIVEGEMDKLALEEAGILNVVSVPDGAPAKSKEDKLPSPENDKKFSYLWNCRGELDQATKIILATDNDVPGQALADELARRLGRERCWRVRWPGSAPAADPPPAPPSSDGVLEGSSVPADASQFRKDANDVLMADGPDYLRDCIEAAEPYPIRGLFRFSDFHQDILEYYGMQKSADLAVTTGWASLDEYYKVIPGELTIITGVPNSGKSEWIDALLVNLTTLHGWSFALCSMEKKVSVHARQLLEKQYGMPFLLSDNSGPAARMTEQQVHQGLEWLDDCFHLIRCEDDELPSVDWVLNLARAAVLRFGIRGLVIDPYNELDHQRPSHMSETEYVSQMLTKIKRFAQHHDVHVWFVAHPRQMQNWKGDPPNLYDISGSAHFINKCDNGIVVHRNNDPAKGPPSEVNILIRKVRNKMAGGIGDVFLSYDKRTGRYVDAKYQK